MIKKDRGSVGTEVAIIAALIATVLIASINNLSNSIGNKFNNISDNLGGYSGSPLQDFRPNQ